MSNPSETTVPHLPPGNPIRTTWFTDESEAQIQDGGKTEPSLKSSSPSLFKLPLWQHLLKCEF